MTEADWNDCRNRFHHGIDWMVSRVGRHWQLAPCYHWPVVFKTKAAEAIWAVSKTPLRLLDEISRPNSALSESQATCWKQARAVIAAIFD